MAIIRRFWMLWTLVVLATAPVWGQNSISISCPSTAAAGSTVNCSMSLALGGGVSVDNLTFGVGASGSPAVTANLGFTSSIPNAFVSGTAGAVSAVWAGLSPALTGNVGLGTVTVPLPGTAVSGNTYTVSITGASASLGNNAVPLSIGGPATVTITGPVLNVPTTSLSFTATQGGANPANQSISVSNSGTGTLTWSSAGSVTTPPGGTWLSASGSGTNSGNVTVSVSLGSLTAGTYSGTVTITAAGAGGSPKVVDVSLTVNPPPPTINRSPASLSFTAVRTGSNPSTQSINISNSGGGTLNWNAAASTTSGGNWLGVAPGSGTNTGTVTVSANIAGLNAGSYSGTVTITAAGATNTPQTVAVTLTITEPPTIGASPSSLTFNAVVGVNPPNQTVNISNTGGGTLSWTASGSVTTPGGGTWLGVTPGSGTNTGTLTVSATVGSLGLGTYTGTITVTAAGASNTPQTIPVTLIVATAPAIGLTPTTLTFNGIQSLANPATQTVAVANTGGGALNWTAAASTTSGGNWLGVTPASGTNAGTLTVSTNTSGLAPGTYNGSITVSATGASNTPQTVAVTLNVAARPTIGAAPTTLSFSTVLGSGNPASQTVNISNTGGGTLNWTAAASTTSGGNWLGITPASGTNAGAITVSAALGSLTAGTYTGTITITDSTATNSPQTVSVTFTVQSIPVIGAAPSTMTFSGLADGANPASQTLSISNTAAAPAAALNWTVAVNTTTGGPWLGATPASGTNSGAVAVSVNTAGLAAGTYSGTVTVTAAGASNSPQTVNVTLTVQNPPSIALGSASLSFSGQRLGPNPSSQTVSVSNGAAAPAATLNWSAAASTSSGGSWLQVSPASGTNTGTLTASINLAVITAPGTYNGTIAVTGAGASNSPQTVAVTLTVAPALPRIGVTPALVFSALPGTSPANQPLAISNLGDGTLNWTAAAATTSGGSWLNINPSAGTNSGSIVVSVTSTSLSSGSYQGTITVTAAGSSNSPQTVQVSLNIGQPPSIVVSPGALNFTATVGGANPGNQTVNVTNSGGGDLFVNAGAITTSGGNWLSVTPTSGFAPLSLTVSVNTPGLQAGTYQGEIGVSSQSGAAGRAIPVTLTVVQRATISLNPSTSLSFSGQEGGTNPATQAISIANSGGGTLDWTASATTTNCGNWLSVSPSSGQNAGTVSVSVSLTGLTPGTCNGNIQIAATGASNTPQNVPVTLTVTSRNQPILTLAPSSVLQFRSEINGVAQNTTVAISNTGGGTLSFSTAATTESGGNWLSVSASSTSAPASLVITVNPSGLSAGGYRGRVAITATGAVNSPAAIIVELAVAAPQINTGGLCDGASFVCGVTVRLGSGGIASLFGIRLASSTAGATALPLPTILAGTQVLVNGSPVPLFYVSPTQINFQIPPGLEGTTVTIQVRSVGITSVDTTLTIAVAAPGIFTVDSSGRGRGAILNEDFGLNGPNARAAVGSVIQIYATGLGALNPPLAAGQPGGSNPLNLCVNAPVVTIGGQNAEVLFCGAAPGFVGLYQVNARIPTGTTPGDAVTVQITVGTAESNIVTISVR